MRYLCPFCADRGKGKDYAGHLYLNVDKGVGVCFRCNTRGSISYLLSLMGIKGQSQEAPPAPGNDTLAKIESLLSTNLTAGEAEVPYPCETQPIVPGTKGHIYLCGARGYGSSVFLNYNIVEGNHPAFGRRVFIPTSENGRRVYWVGRAIDGQKPRYINPAVPKTAVFNLDRVPAGLPLIICEGVFSAIAAHPFAIAIFGKTATPPQVLKLLRFPTSAYVIALDGDAAKEAYGLAESLAIAGRPIDIVEMPSGHDPDSLPAGDLWGLPRADALRGMHRALDLTSIRRDINGS